MNVNKKLKWVLRIRSKGLNMNVNKKNLSK